MRRRGEIARANAQSGMAAQRSSMLPQVVKGRSLDGEAYNRSGVKECMQVLVRGVQPAMEGGSRFCMERLEEEMEGLLSAQVPR